MDIDADMAASSRPRNGLAEKLAQACPECLRRLEDCVCGAPCVWPECDCPSPCGGPVYVMRAPGPFEMPDYRDLPPGAKVLTSSIGDLLYVPLESPAKEPLWPVWLLCAALAVGIGIGYFARGWFS